MKDPRPDSIVPQNDPDSQLALTLLRGGILDFAPTDLVKHVYVVSVLAGKPHEIPGLLQWLLAAREERAQ